MQYIFVLLADSDLLANITRILLAAGADRLIEAPNQNEEIEILALERFTPWLVDQGFRISREAAEHLSQSGIRWARPPDAAIGKKARPASELMGLPVTATSTKVRRVTGDRPIIRIAAHATPLSAHVPYESSR